MAVWFIDSENNQSATADRYLRAMIRSELVGCVLVSVALFGQCSAPQTNQEYIDLVEAWRTERINNLTKARSWTSLAGLYWLNPGLNRFGSAIDNDLKFPDRAPEYFGTFKLTADSLTLTPQDELAFTIADTAVFHGGRVIPGALFGWQTFYWTVLQRADRYAVRLWDTASVHRDALSTIPHYPVNEQWRVPVTFMPADEGTTITLDDIVGMQRDYSVAGTLQGEVGGQNFEILALPGGDDTYFLLIEDATTDTETYGGGRYIYCPKADETGQTIIDFNQAFNPPCAFTEFATCLLPPEQNSLAFAVTAGEKNYGEH